MKTTTQTDIGRLRFQAKRIEQNTKRKGSYGQISSEMTSPSSKTATKGYWSTPGETTHAQFDIYDRDAKENLQVQFLRRKDLLSLRVENPGKKGEDSSISIPLGKLGDSKDKFFSKGFFPSTGITHLSLSVEKSDDTPYTNLEVRRGADTQPQAYRIDDGKIYEVPMDAGFRSYHDFYG